MANVIIFYWIKYCHSLCLLTHITIQGICKTRCWPRGKRRSFERDQPTTRCDALLSLCYTFGGGGIKHSIVRAKHSIVRTKCSMLRFTPPPPKCSIVTHNLSVVIWSKFPTRYPGFASQRSFLRKTNELSKNELLAAMLKKCVDMYSLAVGMNSK